MRWTVVAGIVSILSMGACFEDSSPVETGETASSGSECVAGTEGCPCIEGQCVGALTCLSNTCVDAGATSNPTTGATSVATTNSTSVGDVMDDASVEVGPSEPPMTTSDSGTLPGDPCDPLYQPCGFELTCKLVRDQLFTCEFPGPVGPYEACNPWECGPELACIPAEAFLDCLDGAYGCCAFWCDLFEGGGCAADEICLPPNGQGAPPIPGYEHVGVCATNRF